MSTNEGEPLFSTHASVSDLCSNCRKHWPTRSKSIPALIGGNNSRGSLHTAQRLPKKNPPWDNIRVAHRAVSVSHSWATEQGLPNSMGTPADPMKGTYVIDVYHQIHCLVGFLTPLLTQARTLMFLLIAIAETSLVDQTIRKPFARHFTRPSEDSRTPPIRRTMPCATSTPYDTI